MTENVSVCVCFLSLNYTVTILHYKKVKLDDKFLVIVLHEMCLQRQTQGLR